jgi:hypothetical protein
MVYKKNPMLELTIIILFMNLYMVHGVSNKFVDELFIFLRLLLLADNCLPQNYYASKTLTRRLGLNYKNILLVEKGVSYIKENIKMLYVVQNVEHLDTRMRETYSTP